MDDIGITLHGYEILAKLGQGTSGVVYKARDMRLNRVVALKTPLTDLEIEYSEWTARFLREARVLASLDCKPGGPIPALHCVFEHDGRLFYLREFVEGETLEELVRRKSINLNEAIRVLASIAQTVQWVHERHFVHRNLHPSNILVSIDGSAKLIGFARVGIIDAQPQPATVIDLQALQKMLDWLCFFIRQSVPSNVEALRYGQLSPTAEAFAKSLESCL